MSKYILTLDPSGSFYEGKGTTGWCLLDLHHKVNIEIGNIPASEYNEQTKYWAAHLHMIDIMHEEHKLTQLVIEDYSLYANKAKAQINSKFETCQLIGAIKIHCVQIGLDYTMQPASIKPRYSDKILEKKRVITINKSTQRKFLAANGKGISRHSLDAIRHAYYYDLTERKKKNV